jgi:hypothetical protein
MHRSGTSTLAGTLRAAGVHFGNVLDNKFPLNPKGLQEAPAILYMQEDLLIKNGGSWHEPSENIEWMPLHSNVRNLFVESRQSHELWAFKDPRTLLTLDGWLEAFPELECAGIFRHPAEVAMSIHKRNKFELDKCFEIWSFYNEKLLSHQRKLGFPIIEFVDDPVEMKRSFSTLLSSFELTFTSQAADFFDTNMKHLKTPEIEIPEYVRNQYTQLQQVAI